MSERRLTLAWDCDDVIIPFAHRAVDHYNETYGASVNVAHFYEGAEHWGVENLSTAADRVKQYMREKIDSDPGEFTLPDPEAVALINSWSKIHRQLLVTGRSAFMKPMTHAMSDMHFAGCFEKIIHTDHFSESSRSKGSVCLEEGADILIDDGLMHCESAVEEGEVEVALLFDKPWNQDRILHPRIIRCANLWAVRQEVSRIAGA